MTIKGASDYVEHAKQKVTQNAAWPQYESSMDLVKTGMHGYMYRVLEEHKLERYPLTIDVCRGNFHDQYRYYISIEGQNMVHMLVAGVIHGSYGFMDLYEKIDIETIKTTLARIKLMEDTGGNTGSQDQSSR